MRIQHQSDLSYIEGSEQELEMINKWIEEAQKIDEHIQIGADESYGDEVSLVIVRQYSTQKERQEIFMQAKTRISAK